MVPCLDHFTTGLARIGDDVANVDGLATQGDVAGGQPRDIEQVVDEPDQVIDRTSARQRTRLRKYTSPVPMVESARRNNAAETQASPGGSVVIPWIIPLRHLV
jgi:hypothetical protein